MSTSIGYGKSFTTQYLAEGKVEQALAEANKLIGVDPADPEPVLDRAQVYLAMGRNEDVVADIEQTLLLDKAVQIVEDAVVDDTLFSALLAWGQKLAPSNPEQGVEILARYRRILPAGIHHADVDEWTARFRGQVKTWVKAR